MTGYPLFSAIASPRRKSGRPFDSASISSFVVSEAVPPLPQTSSASSGKVAALVSPTIRTLGKRWSKERLRQGQAQFPSAERIHMTVVHETV